MLPENIQDSLPEPGETVLTSGPVAAASQPAPREPFWGYTDLAMMIGLLTGSIVLLLVFAGLFISARPDLKTDPIFLLATQLGLYVFVYICFWAIFRTRYDRPVFSSLGWRRSNFSPLLAVVCGGVLAFLVALAGSLMQTPKVKSPLDDLTSTPVLLTLFGLMAITVAPLFEEMLFRGFLQPLLSRTLGIVAGIGITASIFGAMHAPEYAMAWQYVVLIALAGAAFGWVRARSNSIIPCTIMHGSFNLASVIVLAVSKYAPHSLT
ncbi:MAG TPA: type II CAAX endopeptidase family protein [Bryobacteraceae bacterium]|nr:type II CAAX endopeptidase family protein [Bryobacteraceae bacterium]